MISANKRLQKEASALKSQKDENIQLVPTAESIMVWNATINAPSQCYYEGYQFDLHINVPSNYPLVPPTIKFKTKIFHPNVMFDVSYLFSTSSAGNPDI